MIKILAILCVLVLAKCLERWERDEPSSFWLCTITICLGFIININSFDALSPTSEVPSQSQAVVGQLRAGGSSNKVIMASLGLGLSTITPSNVSPGLAKGMAWFIAGILSKIK